MENEKKEFNGYIVDGYLFASEAEAKAAQKELQGILYLQKNNNLKDDKVKLQIYQKLLEQGLFHTPIGMDYLRHLQKSIKAKGMMEQVPPIPVRNLKSIEQNSASFNKTLVELNDVGETYKKKFRLAVIISMILFVGLILMVWMASTTNQPYILNYEEKIIDKYENWEKELKSRENKLKHAE